VSCLATIHNVILKKKPFEVKIIKEIVDIMTIFTFIKICELGNVGMPIFAK